MSEMSQGPGWWIATDGKWYPPESAPGYRAPTGHSVSQMPGLPRYYPNSPPSGFKQVAVDPLGRQFALWWQRVGVTIIDSILVAALAEVANKLVWPSASHWFQLVLVFSFLYQGLMLSLNGATLGNLAIGSIVVDASTGKSVSVARAWGRAIAYSLIDATSLLGIIVLLDVLWPLWDAQKQTLHDKVAGTVVVMKASSGS